MSNLKRNPFDLATFRKAIFHFIFQWRVISKAQASESSQRNQKTKTKQFGERARKSEVGCISPISGE